MAQKTAEAVSQDTRSTSQVPATEGGSGDFSASQCSLQNGLPGAYLFTILWSLDPLSSRESLRKLKGGSLRVGFKTHTGYGHL